MCDLADPEDLIQERDIERVSRRHERGWDAVGSIRESARLHEIPRNFPEFPELTRAEISEMYSQPYAGRGGKRRRRARSDAEGSTFREKRQRARWKHLRTGLKKRW